MNQYTEAGVDIDAGEQLVQRIKPITKKTFTPGVIGGLGGFGGLFELPWSDYKNPILVSGTDGVGTKLKLAQQLNNHSTIGIDLVAMCVNDIIVSGAKPLFFLDYFATGKLHVEQTESVISGLANGCKEAGAALIGGETAEMPGMYHGDDYDLAGFVVGLVEKDKLITGETIRVGDKIIGLASSGVHSNGYSLVRKIIQESNSDLSQAFGDTTLGETLLAPTIIYVKLIQTLLSQFTLKGMAHITGGGITENLPRILPKGLGAKVEMKRWHRPMIFDWLQEKGQLSEADMLRTFNCGIGMMLVVAEDDVSDILDTLQSMHPAWCVGEITSLAPQASRIMYV